MSIDLSGLPQLPDPDTIITDAGLVAASGTRVAQHGTTYGIIWNGIQPHYLAPEQSLVYEAMRPVTVFTDEVAVVTSIISDALNTFAEAVRGMKSQYNDLVAAAGISYPESTDEDPDHGKNKEAEVTAGISALAQKYADAEKACAMEILQSDPAQMSGPPAITESKGWDIANETADETLDRVRRERTRILIPSGTTQVAVLQISNVFEISADGTAVRVSRASLTPQDIQTYTPHETSRLTLNPTPGTMTEVPKFAKRFSNALGVLDVGLALYGNYSDQWNQDLTDHPKYTEEEREASARKSAMFESIGGGAGGTLGGLTGGYLGGLAGTALGALLGHAPGAAFGAAAGTFVGSLVGSTVGGALGEGAGSFAQDLTEGKSAGDAWAGAVEEFWKELW